MINTRHNVFETNSSSSHSISIIESVDGILDTIACDENGIITIEGDQYGWEWKAINNPKEKASYCATDQQDKPEMLDMLAEVIKEHTGCNEVRFVFETDEYGSRCYIDHYSCGISNNAFSNKETLKNLLFNPKSYIFTGNDNEHAPPNFYDIGKDLKYKYQLEIDGTDLTFKFTDTPSHEDLNDAIDAIIERHKLCSHSYNIYPNKGYDYRRYSQTDSKGKEYSSLAKLEQGIIILFRTKTVYDNSKPVGNYLGEDVVKSKEIRFRIVEI